MRPEERPVSMVELTLNLDGIDLEECEPSTRGNSMVIREDVIPTPIESRNVEASLDLDTLTKNYDKDKTEDTSTSRQPRLKQRLSESDYTESLANDIIKESVSVLDSTVFMKRMVETEEYYHKMLSCTIKVRIRYSIIQFGC